LSQKNFTEHINQQMRDYLTSKDCSVVFGQNVFAGSRVSGLGKDIDLIAGVKSLNTPNIENSLMATGLGLMLAGTSSVFIMKQHDFAVLGLDQLINSWNLIRNSKLDASFIILMVVVDTGLEGPQANLYNLDEFASLTRAPVYLLSTKENIDLAFKAATTPGLHFMAVGQSQMKSAVELQNTDSICAGTGTLLKLSPSKTKTLIVYFGLNVQLAFNLVSRLLNIDISSDVFAVSNLLDIQALINEPKIAEYQNIIVADSGKSLFSASSEFERSIRRNHAKVVYLKRYPSPSWSEVDAVEFEFNDSDIECIQEALGERP